MCLIQSWEDEPHAAPDAYRVHFGENRDDRDCDYNTRNRKNFGQFLAIEGRGEGGERLPGDIILAKVICCQVDCRHHSHRRRELPYRRVVSVIPEILWGNPRHLSYSLRDTSATSQLEGRS